MSSEQFTKVPGSFRLNVFEVINNPVMSMDLEHLVEIFPGLNLLVEETSVPITIIEPFAPRILPPPLGFLPACFMKVRLQFNLLLNVNVINIFVLHAGLVNLQC